MNREVKAKWIAALRSGKYQQGRHRLVRKEGSGYSYCCLGVLCEVMGATRMNANDDLLLFGYKDTSDEGTIPRALAREVGLDTNPIVTVKAFLPKNALSAYDANMTLAALNDSGRYNFNEIADIIEAQL